MTSESTNSLTRKTGSNLPDRQTLLAFALLVFLIGSNFIAVRFSNRELPPFWGAGTRFAAAGVFFLLYALISGRQFPRGKGLAGSLFFGILQFGVGYALMYWALLEVPAGLASVILASVPLFTLLFASLTRIENLSTRGVLGSLIALAGIAYIYGERSGEGFPALFLLAAIGAAASFALAGVVVKLTPQVHPSTMNAIAMLVGAFILIVLSFVFRENRVLPQDLTTWMAFLYLVLLGSVAVFALVLFTLRRWTATGVSFQLVLSPIVAILFSMLLLDEPMTGGLILGGSLVLVGVYVGALAPGQGRRSTEPE